MVVYGLQAPCQHNFCLGCFTKWVNQGKKTCPTCRHAFPAKFAANPRINTALACAIRMAKQGDTKTNPNKAFEVLATWSHLFFICTILESVPWSVKIPSGPSTHDKLTLTKIECLRYMSHAYHRFLNSWKRIKHLEILASAQSFVAIESFHIHK